MSNQNERTEKFLRLYDMAINLAIYTEQKCNNENVCPKRLRWCSTNDLILYAERLAVEIKLANKGHRYGVVETTFKGRGWTHWGYCPWITYEEKKTTPVTTQTTAPKRSIDEVAKSVINGDYGVGEDRVKRLTAAGYDAKAVQKRVNEILAGQTSAKKKSVTEIAKEVIEGKWGNGITRKLKLSKAGYKPSEVQKEVNRLLKK